MNSKVLPFSAFIQITSLNLRFQRVSWVVQQNATFFGWKIAFSFCIFPVMEAVFESQGYFFGFFETVCWWKEFHKPGLADYNHVIIINDYNHDYINAIKSSFAILTLQANEFRERNHLQVNFIVFAVNSFLGAFIQRFWMGPFEREAVSEQKRLQNFLWKNSELICSKFKFLAIFFYVSHLIWL